MMTAKSRWGLNGSSKTLEKHANWFLYPYPFNATIANILFEQFFHCIPVRSGPTFAFTFSFGKCFLRWSSKKQAGQLLPGLSDFSDYFLRIAPLLNRVN
jgi:hypothetical protein